MASASVAIESRRKLALVIGIVQYKRGREVNNAENDAKDMSSKLESIGFITGGPKINLTYQGMNDALDKFKSSVQPGDMILFYFAGHGTQWKVSAPIFNSKNGCYFSICL